MERSQIQQKWYWSIFWDHSLKIAILYSKGQKFEEKNAFFCKSHRNAVIRVLWHAEFIHALKTEFNPTVFWEKCKKLKIFYHFLFFVIFSKSYKQNCLKTMESCFLDGKKPNSAKMVLINFWPIASRSPYYSKDKNLGKIAFFCKSHKNEFISVFWHAEFISELKTEPNPSVFEKNAKNKTIYYHYFLFFVIFSKSYKHNYLKTMESCFFRWKKAKFSQNGIDQFSGP